MNITFTAEERNALRLTLPLLTRIAQVDDGVPPVVVPPVVVPPVVPPVTHQNFVSGARGIIPLRVTDTPSDKLPPSNNTYWMLSGDDVPGSPGGQQTMYATVKPQEFWDAIAKQNAELLAAGRAIPIAPPGAYDGDPNEGWQIWRPISPNWGYGAQVRLRDGQSNRSEIATNDDGSVMGWVWYEAGKFGAEWRWLRVT